MIQFELGVHYVGDLTDAKVGPLSCEPLWKLLRDGRTLGFMARHIMAATFANLKAEADEFGYSLSVKGTPDVLQTRMVTRNGCDLLMAKMRGVGRHEQRAAQAEWESRLSGWVFIDNRLAPQISIIGVGRVPRDKSSLCVDELFRMAADMPTRRLDWGITNSLLR